MLPDWNNTYASEKNAKKMQEGFQSIGLNVTVSLAKSWNDSNSDLLFVDYVNNDKISTVIYRGHPYKVRNTGEIIGPTRCRL